jgi:hypothetical protein
LPSRGGYAEPPAGGFPYLASQSGEQSRIGFQPVSSVDYGWLAFLSGPPTSDCGGRRTGEGDFGISSRGDAETYHGSAVGGYTLKLSDTSSINVTAAIDFFDESPIMQQDRPFTQQNSNELAAAYPGHPIFPTYAGLFADPSGNMFQVNKGSAPPITAANFNTNTPTDYNDKWYQP